MFKPAFRRARLGAFALSFASLFAGMPSAKADQIDRVMVEDAGAIAKAVHGLKAKNVAVLKFQVKFGDGVPSFKAGTEGAEMVHRLENLLVLSLDPKSPDYTVLTKAGEAASTLAKAAKTPIDWTTPDGRKKLFEVRLPVCWDDKDTRSPDAFVTGTVLVSKNFQEVRIELTAFAKSDPISLKKLGTLAGAAMTGKGITTDRAMLASLGQTYTTSRGLKPTGKARDFIAADEAAATDAANRENMAMLPTADPMNGTTPLAGPVSLQIKLDGETVPFQPDDGSKGEFKVSGKPGTVGQKVTFTLVNNHTEKLAVLLCLNGRNTIALDGETLDNAEKPRAKFRMYVLEPKVVYEIKGFLRDDKGTIGDIVVAGEEESAALYDTMNAATRGKIQMFVYGKAPLPTPNITDAAEAKIADDEETKLDNAFAASGLATVEKGLGKTGNLAAAQRSLTARTKLTNTNGKIAADSKAGKRGGLFIEANEPPKVAGDPVQTVKFSYDEQPLDSVVISYYTK